MIQPALQKTLPRRFQRGEFYHVDVRMPPLVGSPRSVTRQSAAARSRVSKCHTAPSTPLPLPCPSPPVGRGMNDRGSYRGNVNIPRPRHSFVRACARRDSIHLQSEGPREHPCIPGGIRLGYLRETCVSPRAERNVPGGSGIFLKFYGASSTSRRATRVSRRAEIGDSAVVGPASYPKGNRQTFRLFLSAFAFNSRSNSRPPPPVRFTACVLS